MIQYSIFLSGLIFILSNMISKKVNMEQINTFMNKIIINFMLPILIIDSFGEAHLSMQNIIPPLINILWILIMAALSIILCKALKYNQQKAGSLVIASCTSEGGSIGVVIVLLLLHSGRFLPAFITIDVANGLMLFSFVNYLAYRYGKNGKFNFKALKQLFLSPIVLSLVIAIILNKNHIMLSSNISNTCKLIGEGILPCLMVTLGSNFRLDRSKLVFAIAYSIIKLVVGVSIAIILIKLFNLVQMPQIITLLLISALPPSYLITVFIKENKLDDNLVHSIIPVSTIISVIAIITAYMIYFG